MIFKKKQDNITVSEPLIVAVESLHADLCLPFLKLLQKELVSQGVDGKILLLPSSQSLEKIKPLLSKKTFFANSPKSLAVLSAFERKLTFEEHMKSSRSNSEAGPEVWLINNGSLSSQAYFASLYTEKSARVSFYKFIDEFEYVELGLPRPNLTVYVDILEEHVNLPDPAPVPAGFVIDDLPSPELLRSRFLEVANLLPQVKIITGSSQGLLLPDQVIHNQIWELVRRVVLAKNIK